ncbi:MAG: tripartite tricarboxylate transporter substrate binding protein [Betaproteobacteria bacterium]|nr:tripartite tricarboxylate transporter substrate binding protein [Betaproteobacteria bacterium]
MKRILAACLIGLGASAALAEDYPSKPIRAIIPLTPGSGADIVGRILGKHLGDAFGHLFIFENRPGAGGQIGSQAVVKAAPDGYTLLVQSASHAANSAIYKQLPYDATKDFVDVALLGMTPYVMVTSPSGPYHPLKALVDAAKAKPGDIPFASAGVGSSTHLAAEYFAQTAGIRMVHVPYKGSPEAIQDSIAGRTSFYMAPINTAIGLVKEGRAAGLGVSTERRAASLPDVPTIAEQGFPGFAITLWFGMWAPAGTPPAIVRRLNSEVGRILQVPEVREQLSKLGVDPVGMSPEDFARFVRAQIAVYQRIVREAGVQQQ